MKNFEELKEAIKGSSFNESHLSKTQVVDLETVIGLIEDFEQCNIANVVKPKGTVCDHKKAQPYFAPVDECEDCGELIRQ